jgi:hypothetical protein
LTLALAIVPFAYLMAALIGSLVPVNRGWSEPDDGVTIYIANNGLHSDIVMPVEAQGLDWTPFLPKSDFAAPDAERAGWRSAPAKSGSIWKRRAGGTSNRRPSGRQ